MDYMVSIWYNPKLVTLGNVFTNSLLRNWVFRKKGSMYKL